MKYEINKNILNYINKNNKLFLTTSPFANRYWHGSKPSGFSDTYKTKAGTRHRRKYYVMVYNESGYNELKEFLDNLKTQNTNIDFQYSLLRYHTQKTLLQLTTLFTTK